MSPWILAALALAACYAGAVALLWAFQEAFIFHPRAAPAEAKRHAPLSVEYATADGVILRGWLTQQTTAPDAACRLLIYFGGNAEELSERLSESRFDFPLAQLYVNYRGFGDSGGRPSADALRRDALLLYDETRARLQIPPQQICLMGRSLGTHMAAYVAAHREVGKLVLVSPYDSVTNIARMRYPIFPVRTLLRHPFDTLAEAARVRAPTLAILAARDFIVPARRSRNLLKQWRAPLEVRVIAGTTHNTVEGGDYWSVVNRFFRQVP